MEFNREDITEVVGDELLNYKLNENKNMSIFVAMFKTKTFWLAVLTVLYATLVAVVHVIPNVVWLNDLIAVVVFVLVNYFHVNPSQAVLTANQ